MNGQFTAVTQEASLLSDMVNRNTDNANVSSEEEIVDDTDQDNVDDTDDIGYEKTEDWELPGLDVHTMTESNAKFHCKLKWKEGADKHLRTPYTGM